LPPTTKNNPNTKKHHVQFGAKHLNHPVQPVFSETFRKLKKTAKCQHCGNDVVLPFKCAYCGGLFCAEHRLPESHACPESWRAKAPREVPTTTQKWAEQPSYKYTVSYTPKTARIFWFSKTELKHLTIGALLVMGVGLSYFITAASGSTMLTLAILSIAFTLSFLLHELAHKFSAQHFSLWAEFRLTMQGALITLVSIFLPFKLISPGAVMIAGAGTRETVGKISLAGPLTNILLSTGCILIATFTQDIFWFIAFINAFLAAFNLIPFGVMDGLKVFRWNKAFWAIAFVAASALTAYTINPALVI
jgi:Zn-dependent protease